MSYSKMNQNQYVQICVDSTENAKAILSTFISFCKAQAKLEIKKVEYETNPNNKVKLKKSKNPKYIYSWDCPQAKLPFDINVKIMDSNEKKCIEWYSLCIDFDLKTIYNESINTEPYVPISQRIPGKSYRGEIYIPKNDYLRNQALKKGKITQEQVDKFLKDREERKFKQNSSESD